MKDLEMRNLPNLAIMINDVKLTGNSYGYGYGYYDGYYPYFGNSFYWGYDPFFYNNWFFPFVINFNFKVWRKSVIDCITDKSDSNQT